MRKKIGMSSCWGFQAREALRERRRRRGGVNENSASTEDEWNLEW